MYRQTLKVAIPTRPTFAPSRTLLQCCEDREERTVVLQTYVNPIELLSETERIAIDVLSACSAKAWDAAPLDSLGALLSDPGVKIRLTEASVGRSCRRPRTG